MDEKKTDQIVEIVFRYSMINNPGIDFVKILYVQLNINNAVNVATGLVPNEIIYGFWPNDILKMITDLPPENFNRFRLICKE